MLEKRLPVPAYDHLLKLSHTFNLLDARGAVGVTGENRSTPRAAARAVHAEHMSGLGGQVESAAGTCADASHPRGPHPRDCCSEAWHAVAVAASSACAESEQ
jgi:hypothetical protein